jgi:choice-of-anchor B domain-containing protein
MNSRELHSPRSIIAAHLAALVAGLMLIMPAQADDGRPRYVSGSGTDKGDCLNKFRPCRSLDYAIARSGKADYIRVAEGDYTVDDAQKLASILSANGRIEGGFSKYSAYSERNATQKTTLIGVPPEFRERFERAGFTVIVDRKGISPDESAQIRKLTSQILATEKSHSASPCVSNRSDTYPCQSVSLLSHLSLQDLKPISSRGNDVWGFVDLNTNREYAFMGLQLGVAIVDVTDPTAPEQVAFAPGSATTWRDIKVYQRYDAAAKRWRAYAYATADAVSDYLMLLDLSDLPNGVEKVNFASDFTAAHNTYLINSDYTFGLAQTSEAPRLGIAGGRENGGHHRLYSLAQPRTPTLLTTSTAGYAHDLASFPVSDARKNAQCTNAQTQAVCQVLSDFNENTVDIWDVTNPSSPQALSSYTYANASYVHSGWWTEDGRYLFVHDELDESNTGINTTVRVFDMANLRAPTLAGSWVGPTRAIDHNGFVKGNRYYVANYAEGLTVLDITSPAAPQRVGYFDTYPTTSETGFVGAWGVYPFFESGTIAIGDINTGLYLVSNETLASSAGSLAMDGATQSANEGNSITISVSRSGGAIGAASVQLELLHASTQTDDASLSTQLLSWADGDSAPKAATLTFNADDSSEDLELLLVRLKAPQGGASVGYPDTARVYIADSSGTARLRLLEPDISVDESREKTLITVARGASAAGEARVSYRTVANATYTGFTATQGELIWASGDATPKTIAIALDPTKLTAGQTATFEVELSSAVGAELETASGTAAATLVANITVSDTSTPPPTPPPPPIGGGAGDSGGGGGGGSTQSLWLAALGLLGSARMARLLSRRHGAHGAKKER